jgi:hypothetical protein
MADEVASGSPAYESAGGYQAKREFTTLNNVIGVFVLLVLAGAIYGAQPGALQVPNMIILILGQAMLVFAALYYFFLRGQPRAIKLIAVAAVLGIVSATVITKADGPKRLVKEDLSVFDDLTFDRDGLVTMNGSGNNGQVAQMLKQTIADRDAILAAYNAEVDASGINLMSDASALKANPKILKDCKRISELGNKTTEYDAQSRALMVQIEQRIKSLDYDELTKNSMLKGFRDSRDKSEVTSRRSWDLQRSALAVNYDTCMLLARRNWRAAGAVFEFTNDADLSAYNKHMLDLNTMADEITSLLADHKKSAQTDIDGAKNAAKYLPSGR